MGFSFGLVLEGVGYIPIGSMSYKKINHANVGKYTIHGSYGIQRLGKY